MVIFGHCVCMRNCTKHFDPSQLSVCECSSRILYMSEKLKKVICALAIEAERENAPTRAIVYFAEFIFEGVCNAFTW